MPFFTHQGPSTPHHLPEMTEGGPTRTSAPLGAAPWVWGSQGSGFSGDPQLDYPPLLVSSPQSLSSRQSDPLPTHSFLQGSSTRVLCHQLLSWHICPSPQVLRRVIPAIGGFCPQNLPPLLRSYVLQSCLQLDPPSWCPDITEISSSGAQAPCPALSSPQDPELRCFLVPTDQAAIRYHIPSHRVPPAQDPAVLHP